jgi:hypothetical protein
MQTWIFQKWWKTKDWIENFNQITSSLMVQSVMVEQELC